ncbi:MAG TPA: ParB/RepB/Spo0J family partition protein [Nitrososphaeraceae archaeon]
MKSNSLLIHGIIDDIDIHKIKDSTNSIRQKSGVEEDDELAISIKQNGLLQPIVIRPKQINFEIVAGSRRLLACKKLGWKKIACNVIEVDDKAAYEISLSENIQRKTLSPIEEAGAFKVYVTDFGYGGISELASRVGKSPSYITKRIRLLNLHSDILDSITNSVIHTSTAEELSYVKDKSKQQKLASLISEGRLSIKETRGLLKNIDKEPIDICVEHPSDVGTDRIQKRLDVLNKSIIVLRIAMNRLGTIIENIEDDWIFKEILMQHKNMINNQIDLLIKEKRKFKYKNTFFRCLEP